MRRRPEPHWADVVVELRKPGVTLQILWEEYRAVHPGGYGYSRFCELFRSFERRLSPTMRQDHVAGDKVFVDYSGKRIAIVDPRTGEIRQAEIFVAVLGASNFTYAEATWTQTLPDWIGAHGRMFIERRVKLDPPVALLPHRRMLPGIVVEWMTSLPAQKEKWAPV